ncbi:ABC transporter permease subunit [Facklamia sp. DSM 111018]|uniref:ABC transporter permease subunit n=1 Tax=Facklamia lactis TaxID=2749967 RepID=A0ABS0LSQ3_9LACT|nr:ABC transporter permease subunit [Facklamia lactis]MBG9980562.1 ABC transporter permease subunit [Facklamia lactis]MBG9986371.1 ABC transporter permease subunit [Facklamia lactis]
MFESTRLMDYLPTVIIPAIFDTLKMLIISASFTVLLGLVLGFILFSTSEKGLQPNRSIYAVLSRGTDMIRSFPTMILIVALSPLTRILVGTTIGIWPAIVSISIGSIPFAGRMTESALNTVSSEVITAARSFGATNKQIITKVMLVEALPQLIDNFTILIINMLNMTAMAGAIGAGGLGAVALTYGYQLFDYGVMYFIVALLIVLVIIIQIVGNKLKNKIQ